MHLLALMNRPEEFDLTHPILKGGSSGNSFNSRALQDLQTEEQVFARLLKESVSHVEDCHAVTTNVAQQTNNNNNNNNNNNMGDNGDDPFIEAADDRTTSFNGDNDNTEETTTPTKDPFNAGLNQWFEDRNRPQPILHVMEDEDDDDEDEDDLDDDTDLPLIPVEDFHWFESTLRTIEYKYDQRRYQLTRSLTDDRAATPTTVPLEATAIMEQLLDDDMELEIGKALVDMRRQRQQQYQDQMRLLETKGKDSNVPQTTATTTTTAAVSTDDDDDDDQQEKLSRKRALYVAAQVPILGSSDSTNDVDYMALDRLEETLLHNTKNAKSNDRRQLIVDQKVAGMRQKLEAADNQNANAAAATTTTTTTTPKAFQPDNYADWKKYQEIKLYETTTNGGVAHEATVRRKFMDWKTFMARQEWTMEAFAEEEEEMAQDLETMRQYLPKQTDSRDFSHVVADINRKALQALETVLEKRQQEQQQSNSNSTTTTTTNSNSNINANNDKKDTRDLEERIAKLRDSLEAVNYVDVKPRSNNKKKKVVFKDEPVDFRKVFPRQAAEKSGGGDDNDDDNDSKKKKKKSRSEEFQSAEQFVRQDMKDKSARLSAMQDDDDDDDDSNYSSSAPLNEYTPLQSDEDEEEEEEEEAPPVPNTPFFSSTLKKDAMDEKEETDDDNNDDDIVDVSEYVMSGSDINAPRDERSTTLLGTYDEQRMKNLYRQGGAATEEAQQEVKQSLEDFEEYQKKMMRKFEQMDESDLGYDLAEVMTKDGDIDSAKVLSYIDSKAPSTSKVTTTTTGAAPVELVAASEDDSSKDLPDAPLNAVTESEAPVATTLNKSDDTIIEEQSLNAPIQTSSAAAEKEEIKADVKADGKADVVVGSTDDDTKDETEAKPPKRQKRPAFIGKSDINTPADERETKLLGTYEDQAMKNLYRETGLKDKGEQEKFREDFEEFQKYQDDAMQAFDDDDKQAEEEEVTAVGAATAEETLLPLEPVKSATTADDVVVELEPRPSAAERKRRLSQGNTWKQPEEPKVESDASGGTFLGQDEGVTENDDDDDNDNDDDEGATDEEEEDVPEENFEENRRLIEQALGINRPKDGIDIYEALGRRPGQDDFDDDYRKEEYAFPVRRSDVDLSSYQLRKNMLLERHSLSIMEVNSLMDMKDTIEVEGISPYMARINKPFKEFGAVFRLEGVLVDITTLEMRAWKRVAEAINFEPPSRDDVRLASVQLAEYAASRIFYWTNDYKQCREIAVMHDRFINEEVKAALGGDKSESADVIDDAATVAETASSIVDESSESSDLPEPAVDDVQLQRNDLTRNMYIIFAEKYGFRKPTDPELDIATRLPPAQAVEDVFEWAREGNPVGNMVSALKGIYDSERSKLNVAKAERAAEALSLEKARSSESEGAEVVVVEGAISWIKALLDVEMPCGLVSYLDAEIVNLIMDKAGLSELIPIDKRVSTSSGYLRDSYQQLGASLRIDRRPDMCVVFDGNADALMAARDNEMKSIGMTSIYPSYELLAADTTARNFDYLTAMNIRRLFGERDNQEPMLQEFRQEPVRPARPVLTMYPDDETPDTDDDDGGIVKDGYENDDYDDFNFDKETQQDGVIYDDENESDLFQ